MKKKSFFCIILAGIVSFLGISTASGSGVKVPFEYDFTKYPVNFVYLRGSSQIIDGEKDGEKILVNEKDYDVFAFYLDLQGNFEQPLKLTVTAATGKEQKSSMLGALGLGVKDKQVVSSVNINFGWNKRLQRDIFTDHIFIIDPVKFKEKDEGIEGIFVLLYRCNQQGILKISKVKIELLKKEEAEAKPTVKKTPEPEEKQQIFTGYIYPEGTGDSLKLDFFPMGVYTTGEFKYLEEAAKAEGVDVYTIADRVHKELKELGANVVFYQGTSLASGDILVGAEMAKIAAANGIKVIAQPNDVYFRGNYPSLWESVGAKSSKEYFEKYTAPRVKKYLPFYRDNKDILAWAPVEELHGDTQLAQEMAEYRKLIWDICPNHLIYELHSDLNMMKQSKPPYPNIMGIDRYCWWNNDYAGNIMMWTPNLALRWLRSVIRPFIDESSNFNRPCVFVMQCMANYTLEDPAKYPFLKTTEQKKAYANSLVPSLKYYPEIDRFGRWGFFYPPKNAMRAMCWIGVLEGAKGLLVWNYSYNYKGRITSITKDIVENAFASGKNVISIGGLRKNTTAWYDLQKGFSEVRPFGKLLLALKKDAGITAKVDNSAIWINGFKDPEGNKFLIVINSLIATWDGNSPDYLDYPSTKLNIDDTGHMINYEEAKPVTFTVTISDPEGEGLYSIAGPVAVKKVENRKYNLTLEPGQGTVLYLGSAKNIDRIKKIYEIP
ncbi:MAG TPA: hypothetical protein PLE69_05630 [bacterium]|nr:hypothetical protein [bacterium]